MNEWVKIWQKFTPIPPEINEGYLFECRKCKQVLSYGGGKKYPPIQCPNCKRKGDNK